MTRDFELTLTSNATTYNLYTLISADAQIGTYGSSTADFANGFPKQVAILTLQSSGGVVVVTKASGTTGTNYADSEGFTENTSPVNGVDLSDYYLRGDTNSMKVRVRVVQI